MNSGLQARVQITTLRTRVAPLVTVGVHAALPGTGTSIRLLPVSTRTLHELNLRALSAARGGANLRNMQTKSGTHLLMPMTDLRLLLSVTREVNGKPTRRLIGLALTPHEAQGSVKLRMNGGLTTLIEGPLRRLHEDQSLIAFGSHYAPAQEYKDVDTPRFGLHIEGMTRTLKPTPKKTVDELGSETIVFVQRRPRRFGQ